jgi:hypothetical protein
MGWRMWGRARSKISKASAMACVMGLLGLSPWVSPPVGAQQVYRCGNSYSQEPCQNGKLVDTSPTLSDPRGPSTTEIFLCRAPQGPQYWLHEPCARRGWTMERSHRVAVNIPWDDQVAEARRQKAEAEGLSSRPVQSSRPYYGSDTSEGRNIGANNKAYACAAYEAQIAELDRQGRAGSRHYNLDRVRSERKRVRDLHYRDGC